MESTEQKTDLELQATLDELDEPQPERHDYDPERRLWTAVLLQAVLDWRSNNMRARREAEAFLFDSPADLEGVCHRAGLDPRAFQSKLRRVQHTRPAEMVAGLVLAALAHEGTNFRSPGPG
jgi:hypothetical protein